MSITYAAYATGKHPDIGLIADTFNRVIAFAHLAYGRTAKEDRETIWFIAADSSVYRWTGNRTSSFDAPGRRWEKVEYVDPMAEYIGCYETPNITIKAETAA